MWTPENRPWLCSRNRLCPLTSCSLWNNLNHRATDTWNRIPAEKQIRERVVSILSVPFASSWVHLDLLLTSESLLSTALRRRRFLSGSGTLPWWRTRSHCACSVEKARHQRATCATFLTLDTTVFWYLASAHALCTKCDWSGHWKSGKSFCRRRL